MAYTLTGVRGNDDDDVKLLTKPDLSVRFIASYSKVTLFVKKNKSKAFTLHK